MENVEDLLANTLRAMGRIDETEEPITLDVEFDACHAEGQLDKLGLLTGGEWRDLHWNAPLAAHGALPLLLRAAQINPNQMNQNAGPRR
jgi:hypothetical protein